MPNIDFVETRILAPVEFSTSPSIWFQQNGRFAKGNRVQVPIHGQDEVEIMFVLLEPFAQRLGKDCLNIVDLSFGNVRSQDMNHGPC